jgi:protoporphyrin/coproporphyrin ferrochelatase
MGTYDALLVVSFGGPERREDVVPFLEHVLRGRDVPRERLLEVAEHYDHFDGVSPINAQTRELVDALRGELAAGGWDVPIYWGNRNWHPFLTDTVRQMAQAGVRRALAYVTSAFSSYSGCRQYLENIAAARAAVGPQAPAIDKLRVFFNHPGFIAALVDRARQALNQLPADRRCSAQILYTAHSIPLAMAQTCQYVQQLQEACRLISASLGHERFQLVYQSRSGPPHQPWLEPDLRDAVHRLHDQGGLDDLVIVPVGFLSDHVEVLFDLDIEARALCERLGARMVRAGTVGTHPRFVRMIRELIEERLRPAAVRLTVGSLSAWPDVCPTDCCAYATRPK